MLALTCGHCSRDHQEGVKSFFEKRKPEFTAELQNNHPMYPWWYEANVGIEPKGTKGPSRLEKKKKKKVLGYFYYSTRIKVGMYCLQFPAADRDYLTAIKCKALQFHNM